MRARLQKLILASGAGAAFVLVLLLIAAATGSQVIAMFAGVFGILGIIAAVAVITRISERFVESADRLSTRARNLEARTALLSERIDASEARVGVVEKRAGTVEDVMPDLDSRAGLLESRARAIARRTEGLEARAVLHDERIEKVVRQSGLVSTSLEHVREDLATATKQGQRNLKDLAVLRTRVPAGFLEPVENQLIELRSGLGEALRSVLESALQLGRHPREVISERVAHRLFKDYLEREEYLQLRPLIENFGVLEKQSLTTLRRMYRYFRSAGYWDLASLIVAKVYAKSGRENDALAVAKIEHEIALFSDPALVRPELPEGDAYDPTGPILHMVGRVLPYTQTGYTLRTQYTALAQSRKGLPVAIVGQSGITDSEVIAAERYEHQGIAYYLLPGPARNTTLIDEWLERNIVELGALARELRPSILHAQSDFFNALIVDAVGKKYGIPTVYESRGFWEESWLSRTITSKGWDGQTESLFSMYGLPAAYELRKHAEEVARLQPDHVFTLAEVMRDHILGSTNGQLDGDKVSIVPNAVESANFPVQEPNVELASEIGLPHDAVVVGYISSMVEYEGIDTLIDAYHLASKTVDRPICLLLVGDGDYLELLKRYVERRGISNVYFTGRVPHEKVLDYYGIIDLFVVPRKASTVADLVTPLKPFEAFSTGRAVILSDVKALKEIANQSNAVEMFRAGDSEQLSRVLVELIEDPQRRADMSVRAARWVRHYRSWDRNVNEYYRVYKGLGYDGPDNLAIESELELSKKGANPGELIEAMQNTGLPPLAGWFSISLLKQSAESILKSGWRYDEFDAVPVGDLRTIEDWASYGKQHRSWGFNLHTWKFMDPLLQEYDDSGAHWWLAQAARIAIDWIRVHRNANYDNDEMAWYDMSQALRTARLIAITLRAARVPEMRVETIILAAALEWHLEELHYDRAFNPNNNHGFYTAVSQVHAAKYVGMLPGALCAETEGRNRLALMANSQFGPDGVHLEHSPEYHRMLLSSFELAVKDGLIFDQEVKDRIEKAAYVLGWMIQPDGKLVQFGDTPEKFMLQKNAESIDSRTDYLLSSGSRGIKPEHEMVVFERGGYAFVRSPQPSVSNPLIESSYLAFSAGFHSRAHKHADDLNVAWFDRGQEILVDGGRFGYGDLLPPDSELRKKGFYYGSEERQYVEGTLAHNTLMVDGSDQERRSREPYGSGIGECVEKAGVFDLSGRVQHGDYAHRRRLVFKPGSELLFKDSIFSQSPHKREAILWFNIAGHFELAKTDEAVEFISRLNGAEVRLVIQGPGQLIEPVRGQQNPLRGWRSRADQMLEPSWSLGFEIRVDTRASVETRLRLA